MVEPISLNVSIMQSLATSSPSLAYSYPILVSRVSYSPKVRGGGHFLSSLLFTHSRVWSSFTRLASFTGITLYSCKGRHSFNNTSNLLLHHPTFNTRTLQKLCSLRLCRSMPNDSSSEPEGDLKKQELLAKIVMLQAQKYRLTDYLDERSAFLTQFAEEANAEIDAIGENALKDLDEASARIMENIESKMQEFEESSEMSKEEIAKRDKELADFEGDIVKGRNEGLFFQSLQEKKPVDKAKAKEEANKVSDVTRDSSASKLRKNVYLALMVVMAVGIADSFVGSEPDWRKVAVLGAIFIGLLSQFIYEQNLLIVSEKRGNIEDKDDEKK